MAPVRLLVLIAVLAIMRGCPTEVRFQSPGDPDTCRRALSSVLRRDGYSVTSDAQNLIVKFPAYEGRTHGLFGMGPKWQEKAVVTITFSPYESRTNIEAIPKIYERQNDNFNWVETGENERSDKVIRPLF